MIGEVEHNAEEAELKVKVSLYFGPELKFFKQEYRNKEKYLLLKSDIETDGYLFYLE